MFAFVFSPARAARRAAEREVSFCARRAQLLDALRITVVAGGGVLLDADPAAVCGVEVSRRRPDRFVRCVRVNGVVYRTWFTTAQVARMYRQVTGPGAAREHRSV